MNYGGENVGELPKWGLLLHDNVDVSFLQGLQPQHFRNRIKFVVNLANNRCAVGMEPHAAAKDLVSGENNDQIFGGSIHWDGTVDYESTLNVEWNLAQNSQENARKVVDLETIFRINLVLYAWVLGLDEPAVYHPENKEGKKDEAGPVKRILKLFRRS